MSKYIVGHTYKALFEGEAHSFEVLEIESESGLYGIDWDDGCEECAYEYDMDKWVSDLDKRTETIERTKKEAAETIFNYLDEKMCINWHMKEVYLTAIIDALEEIEKRTLGTVNTVKPKEN